MLIFSWTVTIVARHDQAHCMLFAMRKNIIILLFLSSRQFDIQVQFMDSFNPITADIWANTATLQLDTVLVIPVIGAHKHFVPLRMLFLLFIPILSSDVYLFYVSCYTRVTICDATKYFRNLPAYIYDKNCNYAAWTFEALPSFCHIPASQLGGWKMLTKLTE